MLQQHLKTDLGLAYEAFDQTDGQGFRPLASAGCFKEGADLIEAYISKTQATQRSLRWHIAQLRGQAGDYPAAIKAAKSVLSESEDFSQNPMRWNDYVLGTIAFLEKDKEKLILHRNKLVEGIEAYPNQVNLKALDALINNFNESYAVVMLRLMGARRFQV